MQDILDAIAAIRSYTAGMRFDQFSSDRKTVDAVIRNLEVIGEASRRLPANVKNNYPNIPWAEMSALKNILAHEYFSVDTAILWSTIQNDLSGLEEPLKAVLASAGDSTG